MLTTTEWLGIASLMFGSLGLREILAWLARRNTTMNFVNTAKGSPDESVAFVDAMKLALDERIALGTSGRTLGLASICVDASMYDFGDAFSKSQSLIIVLNDGRTWLSVNRDRLRRRLVDTTKDTSIYLIHPDSPMVDVLARKGSIGREILRGRIQESVQLIRDISNESSHVEVLGHFLFNPSSLVLSDDAAILTPYFFSRGGRTVPSYVFSKGSSDDSLYDALLEDVEGLRKDCRTLLSLQSDGDRPMASERLTGEQEVAKVFPLRG